MDNKKATVSRIMIFALNACLLYLVGRPFISSLIYTNSGIEESWSICIAEGIVLILTVVMAVVQRKDLPSYGLQKASYKGTLKYLIPLTVLSLMLIPYFFYVRLVDPLLPAILDIIFIGIMEEFIFRGLIYRATEVIANEHAAIIISSILFGLLHLTNLSGDYTWQYVLLQVAFNAALGLGLGVLRAKTGSIFGGLIFHIFLDINGLFKGSIPKLERAHIVMYFVVGILIYVLYRIDNTKKDKKDPVN